MPARVAFLHDHTITTKNVATKNVACETICGVPRDLLYEDLLYANRTSTGRIGGRRPLARRVSWGSSGGTQQPCRGHLRPVQLGFHGKPLF